MKERKQGSLKLFLVLAFGLAWALQIASAGVLTQAEKLGAETAKMLYTLCNSLCMLMPGVAVAVTCKGLSQAKSGIRWTIRRMNVLKGALIAVVLPCALTMAGAMLYVVCFPSMLSLDGPSAQMLMASLSETGIPMQMMLPLMLVSSAIGGGFINMFFALGEEIGWTGYLVPRLAERMGMKKAVLLRGVIWGLWHAPLIILAGYEYGVGYWGAPWTGVLVMMLFTTGLGAVLVKLYTVSESIWVPALAHGVCNALAGLPLVLLPAGTTGYVLGPTMAGLVAGIPLYVVALVCIRSMKN